MTEAKKHGLRQGFTFIVIVALLGGYVILALSRPLPTIKPDLASFKLELHTPVPTVTWPGTVQAAAGVVGTNAISTHGEQKAAPTASVAKIITALTVLHSKPITPGTQGPTIILSDADVALYNNYVAQDGSVVPVSAGEQITEYQMLEAMLLPSANNMADSLAIWAFGSLPNYQTAASAYTTSLGLNNTHVGTDASGLSPTTTSTASDLVKLGDIAMEQPVIEQIVGEQTATDIPGVDSISNVNFLLGSNGIVGIKTGNSDEAGGVFLSAAHYTVESQTVTIVTAVIGAPTLFDALQETPPIISSLASNIKPVAVIHAGDVVGSYRMPWGAIISATAQKALNVTAFNGSAVPAKVSLQTITTSARQGQVIGQVTTQKAPLSEPQTAPITLSASATIPPTWWRLLYPNF